MSADLSDLKKKLTVLEKSLQELLHSMNIDLEVAREVQKILMPNRLAEIPGLTCFARYVSAQQVSSEAFDIIPTKDARQLWVVTSWTETFGLSSILLQSLVHLQSTALLQARPDISPHEVFNEVSAQLAQVKRAGRYRLSVSRLDIASLQMTGVAIGHAPWIRRASQRNRAGAFEFVQTEGFTARPEWLQPANSSAPVLADRAYNFSFSFTPGTRLYRLGSDWNPEAQSLQDFAAPLLWSEAEKKESVLIDDLNHLLITAEAKLKSQGREADLTALAFEIDSRKLHLA